MKHFEKPKIDSKMKNSFAALLTVLIAVLRTDLVQGKAIDLTTEDEDGFINFNGQRYDVSNFVTAGDILLTQAQINDEVTENDKQSERRRRGTHLFSPTVAKFWKDNVVPYVFNFDMNEEQKMTIRHMMKVIERRSCLRFVEYSFPHQPKDFLAIILGKSCSASVGASNFPLNILSLKYPECFNRKTILHELLHVLGLYHEQQRMDRDSFVKINWENIKKGQEYNFRKVRSSVISGLQYNKQSIMHYKSNDFSVNGQPTIECINSPSCKLGNEWLTWTDIKHLRTMYNCPTRPKC